MPTQAGTPLNAQGAPAYIGPLNPHDWMNKHQDMFAGITPHAITRGHPAPFSWWQRKPPPAAGTVAQPVPLTLHSRGFSRGAGAYAPKFGVLNINPIGAGVYAPYRLPTIAGPGARYQFGAIWFDVQTIPTSLAINPTIPIETLNALIATSYVGGMYPTLG